MKKYVSLNTILLILVVLLLITGCSTEQPISKDTVSRDESSPSEETSANEEWGNEANEQSETRVNY